MPVPSYRDNYRLSILASLSGTLLLCILLVEWWPVESTRSLPATPPAEDEDVQIETVTPTKQRPTPPPPPPAVVAPAISVPNEMVPREEPLDLNIAWQSAPPADGRNLEASGSGRDTASAIFSTDAPQPIHFAEPTYPQAAWKRGISAQIVVEVTVDQEGRAQTHRITDRYLIKQSKSIRSVSAACCSQQIMRRELAETSKRARVSHLGHGLEEAALGAAWKWRFDPPTKGGKSLWSSAVLTFTFGR